MTAIIGTFASMRMMADGTPRIVLDLQCTLAEFAAMNPTQGTPFGIARLSNESTKEQAQTETAAKDKPGPLCILACTFCGDPVFADWIYKFRPIRDGRVTITAKEFILNTCGINSRKELDDNPLAADLFHRHIRIPFLKWKDERAKS